MLSTRAPFQAATVSRTTAVRGASLVVSARPSKAADFRGLDNGEILQKVDELKREKLRLQYMQRTRGNMLNPGEVRQHAVSWPTTAADPQQQQQQWQHPAAGNGTPAQAATPPSLIWERKDLLLKAKCGSFTSRDVPACCPPLSSAGEQPRRSAGAAP